ncbi:ABC transporter substrate-binding protein [Actinocorallia sp. A-T 12471]|uniref:ABC transporter substrate-binding protein n=1 Tax=Actinocorallia sp. A-T 12471 TaxID=3089813 RepID=UPI0029D134D1|nr:ABC transporter substrate-binding protein [Actinocorallia sp. A-T 12471]MDX6741328.1 ABC transporter substrate-binding protein [Actinocorallia sp. A-T 12471]
MSTTLSRRTLLSGLAGGAVLLSLTGCASAVDAEGSGEPQEGGTFLGAIGSDLVPANFYTNSNHGVTTIIGLVFESLVHYPNDSLKAEPRLAESWTISDDGLTVTLNLRKDVKFHTGRALTSDDVKFSLETYADPKWNGQLKSTAAAIKEIDTKDPNVAVLRLAHPLGNILDLLEIVPIVDKETFAGIADGSKYVGTGPFKFDKWTPNARLQFSKNPDYRVAGRPYLDAVDIAVVADATAQANQIRGGQIDYAYGISNLDVERLEKTGKISKIQLTGAETQIYVGTNVTAEGLKDIRVRQAIAYALDRERILAEVFRGSGYTANLPWPKTSPAYDEKLNSTYTRDVAKAKELLADYGKKVPTLKYNYQSPSPLFEATAQIVQANLKEIGIEVELEPLDAPTFVAQLIGGKFAGLWTTYHSWAQYTPSTLTVSAYPFNALKNTSHFSSDDYTKHADAAWKQLKGDSPEAIESYAALSKDLLDNLFLIEIAIIENRWAVSERVKGVGYTKRLELVLTDAQLTG